MTLYRLLAYEGWLLCMRKPTMIMSKPELHRLELTLFADMALDPERRELRSGPKPIAVEPQVFDLLEFLIRHRDRVVSRDDLLAAVWRGRIVSDSSIAARVNAARRAIGDSGEQQRWIRTHPLPGPTLREE